MAENADNKGPESPDLEIETPPSRLLSLLIRIVIDAPDELNGQPVGKVLAGAMGVEPVDLQAAWSEAHHELVALLADAREYVKARIPDYAGSPHEATFHDLNDIITTLPMNDGWKGYRNKLRTLVRSSLPFAAFHGKTPGQVPATIPAAEVRTIRLDIASINERVLTSNWPPAFKAELSEALAYLHDRLTRFEIFGPEGVSKGAAQVFGTLAMNQPAIQSNPRLAKDTVDIVIRVADVFLKYYAIGMIGAQVLKSLGAGG
jgi:hypothetical protein